VLVVGAGLTGIEAATEMPGKLRTAIQQAHTGDEALQRIRVILMDHNSLVGSDMGDSARPVIEEAARSLNLELRVGVSVTSIVHLA
jgi:NADH dehydrogenase